MKILLSTLVAVLFFAGQAGAQVGTAYHSIFKGKVESIDLVVFLHKDQSYMVSASAMSQLGPGDSWNDYFVLAKYDHGKWREGADAVCFTPIGTPKILGSGCYQADDGTLRLDLVTGDVDGEGRSALTGTQRVVLTRTYPAAPSAESLKGEPE